MIDYFNLDNKLLKDIKKESDKSNKKINSETSISKEDKKLKRKNKCQKYVILIMSCIILFISYHFLLQYSDNLKKTLYIKEKQLLNYQKNLDGREKELNLSLNENDLLKSELYQLQGKFITYSKQNEILKKEYDKILEELDKLVIENKKYKDKYNRYQKEFENISNTFHSFFNKSN